MRKSWSGVVFLLLLVSVLVSLSFVSADITPNAQPNVVYYNCLSNACSPSANNPQYTMYDMDQLPIGDFVVASYGFLLDRAPSRWEIDNGIATIRAGTNDFGLGIADLGRLKYLLSVYNSNEYQNIIYSGQLSTISTDQFVKFVYIQFLGRAASTVEVNGGVAYINSNGVSRSDYVYLVLQSDEFRGRFTTYAGNKAFYKLNFIGIAGVVNDLYLKNLGYGAAPDGIAYAKPYMISGGVARDLAAHIYPVVHSTYYSESVTDHINWLYSYVLGRTPSADDLNYWVGVFNAHPSQRVNVTQWFLESDEAQQRIWQDIISKEAAKGNFGTGNIQLSDFSSCGMAGDLICRNANPIGQISTSFLYNDNGRCCLMNKTALVPAPPLIVDAYQIPVNQYIDGVYQLLLRRHASNSSNEMGYWAGQFPYLAGRPDLVAQIFNSTEYRVNIYGGSISQLTNDQFVNFAYGELLGRAPDTDGKTYWLNNLTQGVSRYEVVREIAASMEFSGHFASYVSGGNNGLGYYTPLDTTGRINLVYHYFLGLARNADPAGLSYWPSFGVDAMMNNIMAGVYMSAEYKNGNAYVPAHNISDSTNDGFVEQLYVNLLGRTSDPLGKSYWIARLTAGDTKQQVAAKFMGSDEFRVRFSDFIASQQGGISMSMLKANMCYSASPALVCNPPYPTITDAYWAAGVYQTAHIQSWSNGTSIVLKVTGFNLDGVTLNYTVEKEGAPNVYNLYFTQRSFAFGNGEQWFIFTLNQTGMYRFKVSVIGLGVPFTSGILNVTANAGPPGTTVSIVGIKDRGIYYAGINITLNGTTLTGSANKLLWTMGDYGPDGKEITKNDSYFNYTYATAGQKIITFTSTNALGQSSTDTVSILVIDNKNGTYAFVDYPEQGQFIPSFTDNAASFSFRGNGSYAVESNYANTPGCPALKISCIMGNCPASTEDSPTCAADTTVKIPVTGGNQPFTNALFDWKFYRGNLFIDNVSGYGVNNGTFSYAYDGEKRVVLSVILNKSMTNSTMVRTFTLNTQCSSDRTIFYEVDPISGLKTNSYPTMNSSACAGANHIAGDGDDCCPAGYVCSTSSTDPGCYQTIPNPGDMQCSYYKNDTSCNNDTTLAPLDPAYTSDSNCASGKIMVGSTQKTYVCACGWVSGICQLTKSTYDENPTDDGTGGNVPNGVCAVSSTITSDCVEGQEGVTYTKTCASGTCDASCTGTIPGTTQCGLLQSFELSFTGIYEIIGAVIIIVVIYYFIVKNSGKKTKKGKSTKHRNI